MLVCFALRVRWENQSHCDVCKIIWIIISKLFPETIHLALCCFFHLNLFTHSILKKFQSQLVPVLTHIKIKEHTTCYFIFGNSDRHCLRGKEEGLFKWQFKMWFSIEPVLSKVSFLLFWPFLHFLLLICFLSSLTVMYSSFPPLLCILYFSSTSLWHDAPFPAFCLFPFTGFSFLISNSCPFFAHVFITFLLHVNVCISSISLPRLLNTPLSFLYDPLTIFLLLQPSFALFPFASSIGWLSWRSLPWSLQRRCTTMSTRGLQTTSTFKQGNGSQNQKCMALTHPINAFIYSKRVLHSHWDCLQCSNNTGACRESRCTKNSMLPKRKPTKKVSFSTSYNPDLVLVY